jgi:hypothetical protein
MFTVVTQNLQIGATKSNFQYFWPLMVDHLFKSDVVCLQDVHESFLEEMKVDGFTLSFGCVDEKTKDYHVTFVRNDLFIKQYFIKDFDSPTKKLVVVVKHNSEEIHVTNKIR